MVDETFEDVFGRTVVVKQLRNLATGEFAEILLNTPGHNPENPATRNRSSGSGATNGVVVYTDTSDLPCGSV